MKSIYIFIVGLAFLYANPTTTTFFLDGSKASSIKSKDIKNLTTQIKNKNINLKIIKINKKGLIEKKRNKLSPRGYSLINKIIDRLSDHYKCNNQKINIIAVGYGIPILRIILEYFKNIGVNIIGKAIIIENLNETDFKSITPIYLKKTIYGKIVKKPIRTLKIAQKTKDNVGFKLIDAIQAPKNSLKTIYAPYSDTSSYLDSYEESADSESLEISETTSDYSESNFKYFSIKNKNQHKIDFKNILIIISLKKYFKLLELQQEEQVCCSWLSTERINAITGIGSLIVSILSLCI